jgi:hypothetical protein
MAIDYLGGSGIANGTINNSTWYSPDSTWIYDYTNTPRLVDVPVTLQPSIPMNRTFFVVCALISSGKQSNTSSSFFIILVYC